MGSAGKEDGTVKNDKVRRYDVQKMLQDTDGWNAPEEFFKSQDKAINAALMRLEELPSAGTDLIRRSDVMDALPAVFRKYRIGFEPCSQNRGFASAVPQAIRRIPNALEPRCENDNEGGL